MNLPTKAHAILAHYFHQGEPRPQGSLTPDEWEAGLDAYGPRLIGAHEWIERALAGKSKDEVMVSFDDGLREALTFALPALDKRGLTACWNIYTGPLVGVPNNLERWRWLRNFGFGGVEGFYTAWHEVEGPYNWRPSQDYLADRLYLTKDDKHFRYWRNTIVPTEYEKTMLELEARSSSRFDSSQHWLSFFDIHDLYADGHVIGFHTHSHPTNMARLSIEQQALEYATSKGILELCLERPVTVMAHPCDSWTEDGIKWLQANGVRLAWGGTMAGEAPWHTPRWSTGNWRLS